ncbi:MAG: DUF1598 domain-containing protein [Planctomycetaceae bacterium]
MNACHIARPIARGLAARWIPAVACVAVAAAGTSASAQFGGAGGFGRFGGVGGIAIDAEGVVQNLEPRAVEALAAERRAALAKEPLPGAAGELRKVSLARIIAALTSAPGADKPLPVDVAYLGGLERITHVFVDPDGHDIVLAGPGGVPTIDAAGNVVAKASGRPLLHLEDLVTCLRTIDAARRGGMTCSIDPTPEGLARVQQFLAGQKTMGPDRDAVFRGMEQALGSQRITVGGVPGDSRFARVLVAADYRLKRIGMGLEASGVRQLPSYLAMVPAGGKAATLPRFWLEADYEPIAHDPDELAWRIGGRRMKCLTEADVLADGAVQRGRGAADPVATKWCAALTEHYDAVAAKHPVFTELVGCVDLAVVAALIQGRHLAEHAGLDLGPLLDAEKVPLPKHEVPSSVPTVASGLKKGNVWLLSASGGVMVQPWAFAANVAEAADVAQVRKTALAARPADATGPWWD